MSIRRPGGRAALSVLVVDDDQSARVDLARLLHSSRWVAEVISARDTGDALAQLSSRRFDAVFIDIRMPGVSGVDLVTVTERFSNPPAVVVVSAYPEAAVRAFEVSAIDFLLKPISRRRLEDALARLGRAAARRSTLPVAEPRSDRTQMDAIACEVSSGKNRSTRLVARASILYLQAEGDHVRIVSDDGRFLHRGTLADIERGWMSRGFHRIHRAYVVNLRRVVEVRPKFGGTASVVLVDGTEIPVARRQVADLLQRLKVDRHH